jgi:hypothetical protein
VTFHLSALRYSIKNSVHHALSFCSSQASDGILTVASTASLVSQLCSRLLLNLPLLHTRALVGQITPDDNPLESVSTEFIIAIRLLKNRLPLSFKNKFNEAVSALFPRKNHSIPTRQIGIDALEHFHRFYRGYFNQIVALPECVVQYAVTFPQGIYSS